MVSNYMPFFNDLFNDCCSFTGKNPSVDIHENDKRYKVVVDLPGYNQEDVSLKVDSHVLSLKSLRKNAEKKENDDFLLSERNSYEFNRSFKLPKDVDESSINAKFKNGILTIKILKKPKVLPKQIKIDMK